MAESKSDATKDEPNTNFMAPSRSLSYPTSDNAVSTFSFPTFTEKRKENMFEEYQYSEQPLF